VGEEYSDRIYGAARMTGIEWTDNVCVTNQACIKDFEFFLISVQTGLLEPVDGFFGLARKHPYYLAEEAKVTRGPSYMHALEKAGLISENTFSFYMANFEQESFLDFGKPKEDRMRDPDELRWIDLHKDFFWSAMCQGVAIGSFEHAWGWGSIAGHETMVVNNEIYSMFDSGASAIVFPQFYFPQFLEKLFEQVSGKDYELGNGYVLTKCYDDFPTVYFMFDEHWIGVYPDEYVVDVSQNQDRSMCVLLFSQGEHAFMVMGVPLYQDYYTIHDEAGNRMGFVPHATSDKPGLAKGTVPVDVIATGLAPKKPISLQARLITWSLILVFIVGWIFAIYYVY